MKIVTNHSSVTVQGETPHLLETSRTNTIVNALKRRAQAVLHDKSIDPQSRAVIQYALETHDPWLSELVRRADARENDHRHAGVLAKREMNEDRSCEQKIERLTEIICRADDAPETSALRCRF